MRTNTNKIFEDMQRRVDMDKGILEQCRAAGDMVMAKRAEDMLAKNAAWFAKLKTAIDSGAQDPAATATRLYAEDLRSAELDKSMAREMQTLELARRLNLDSDAGKGFDSAPGAGLTADELIDQSGQVMNRAYLLKARTPQELRVAKENIAAHGQRNHTEPNALTAGDRFKHAYE